MTIAVAAKVAIAAVLVSAAATAVVAADLRHYGGPKRHVGEPSRYVYVDDGRIGIHCDGGYVYAGPHADACAFPSPVPYARDPDPYYYGWYGPRLRYRYAPAVSDYYYGR